MIADRIGLTQASVSRITRDLIDAGLVEEGEVIDSGNRGRRFIGLKSRPGGCFVAGITINAFRQDVVLGDVTNAELKSRRLKIEDLNDPQRVFDKAAKTLDELVDQSGIAREKLIGCGVTITGAVDPDQCVLRSAPVLGWENLDINQMLGEKLNLPIFMDNIPNAKNLAASHYGPTKGIENVVLLNASLGIGCSLMMDGRLLRGRDFAAGLIDSLNIYDPSQKKENVLDLAAGGFGVVKSLNNTSQHDGILGARQLIDAMQTSIDGHQPTIEILENTGFGLARAISTINTILHPEVFLLSGPLIENEHYLQGVHNGLSELVGPEFVNDRVRCSFISNQESARSLAIYQSLLNPRASHLKPDRNLSQA